MAARAATGTEPPSCMLLFLTDADDNLVEHVFAEPAVAAGLVATCREIRASVLSRLLQRLRDERLAHLFSLTEPGSDPFFFVPRSRGDFANLHYCDWSRTPMTEYDARASVLLPDRTAERSPPDRRLQHCSAILSPGCRIDVSLE